MLNSTNEDLVVGYIRRLRKDRKIDQLFNDLEGLGDVIVVGGVVRDIVYGEKEPRDIDLIICCASEELQKALWESGAKRNRFGGYKIERNGMLFDIWSIDDHWPFAKGILDKNKENIEKGAFYNIDAACVNLATSELFSEGLDVAMRTKMLDIIVADDGLVDQLHVFNVMRAYRLKQQWGLEFSNRVQRYIDDWFDITPDAGQQVIVEAVKHFGDTSFLSGRQECIDRIK